VKFELCLKVMGHAAYLAWRMTFEAKPKGEPYRTGAAEPRVGPEEALLSACDKLPVRYNFAVRKGTLSPLMGSKFESAKNHSSLNGFD
jgi:hypothetical protein